MAMHIKRQKKRTNTKAPINVSCFLWQICCCFHFKTFTNCWPCDSLIIITWNHSLPFHIVFVSFFLWFCNCICRSHLIFIRDTGISILFLYHFFHFVSYFPLSFLFHVHILNSSKFILLWTQTRKTSNTHILKAI